MLRIHRYTDRATGKSSIKGHVYKRNRLIKSYPLCDAEMIDYFVNRHRNVELVNVERKTDLDVNVIKQL